MKIHWFSEDVAVELLAITLVGMANTMGGCLYIGVSETTGRAQGVQSPDTVIDRIYRAALMVSPPLVLPLPQVEMVARRIVVRVLVPEGLPNIYSHEGRFFGRDGSQTIPLSPQRLRGLLMERGTVQFERQVPPNVLMEDLDQDQVSAYVTALSGWKGEPYEDVLLRRGCLQRVDGVLNPTYSALLLFGKHPQQWLPSATILATRFPGTSFSDSFIKQDIRGTLAQQIRQAETFVRDHLRSTVRLVGLTREETPEYPFEAIRELIVNAVAHRDYNLQGDGIHLNIFADRLEIHSPGKLPGPINLENILISRFSRNAAITQLLSDLGFVERLGYGLNRVVTVLRQNSLPEPKFEEVGNTFRVTLYNLPSVVESEEIQKDVTRYLTYNLNSRQEKAIGYLVNHGRITNRDYKELCPEFSPETLRRDLVDLVRKGVLLKIGHKKSTYYIFKSRR